MTAFKNPTDALPNLTALASAPMASLVADIVRVVKSGQAPTKAPDATQLADYAMSEAIRLIRLGTRVEIARAAVALSQFLITPTGRLLESEQPSAHKTVAAASAALSAATSPASRGGELTVLRSFSGKALAAVAYVSRAEEQAIPRATLLRLLDVEESYMSHLLADLEVAGLIERIRDGRTVTVHLGPRAYSEHVKELIATVPDPVEASSGVSDAEVVCAALERVRADASSEADPPIELDPLRQLWERYARLRDRARKCELTVGRPVAGQVVVPIELEADVRGDRVFEPSGPFVPERRQTIALLCVARVEGERVVEAELWAPHDARHAANATTFESPPPMPRALHRAITALVRPSADLARPPWPMRHVYLNTTHTDEQSLWGSPTLPAIEGGIWSDATDPTGLEYNVEQQAATHPAGTLR